MLALAVSIIFFNFAAISTLPRGTYVNGVDVSCMSKTKACNVLKESVESRLKSEELRICAGELVYSYKYPEFNYTQNFMQTLNVIRRAGNYFSDVNVYLNGESEVADYICADVQMPAREPQVIFNSLGQPFTYIEGAFGAEVDRAKLIGDIRLSLNSDFKDVVVTVRKINCTGNMGELIKKTQLLYTFTTYFDGDNAGRAANIKLAAQKINGTILHAGESFSFNSVVGARTAQNGFNIAKIIEDGKYLDGVGGGVCQVSTTLYNAALLSGLEIVEYHPHSLSVGYVSPSRDAMVSGNYFDLKFKNNKLTPIYIRTNVDGGSVTCSIYGESDGFSYSFVSEVQERDESGYLSSCGYLIKEMGGIVKRELVRRDKYGKKQEITEN
jgi:vancomycin resistance protein YoaR